MWVYLSGFGRGRSLSINGSHTCASGLKMTPFSCSAWQCLCGLIGIHKEVVWQRRIEPAQSPDLSAVEDGTVGWCGTASVSQDISTLFRSGIDVRPEWSDHKWTALSSGLNAPHMWPRSSRCVNAKPHVNGRRPSWCPLTLSSLG